MNSSKSLVFGSLIVLSLFVFFYNPQFAHAGMSSTIQNQQTDVDISNFSFNPSPISTSNGNTVTWTNNDPVAHTVTSDNGLFDSGIIQPGQSFSLKFSSSGTFPYHCTIHPMMRGTVTVGSASSSNSTSMASPTYTSNTTTPTNQQNVTYSNTTTPIPYTPTYTLAPSTTKQPATTQPQVVNTTDNSTKELPKTGFDFGNLILGFFIPVGALIWFNRKKSDNYSASGIWEKRQFMKF